jgi:hypothetical protein
LLSVSFVFTVSNVAFTRLVTYEFLGNSNWAWNYLQTYLSISVTFAFLVTIPIAGTLNPNVMFKSQYRMPFSWKQYESWKHPCQTRMDNIVMARIDKRMKTQHEQQQHFLLKHGHTFKCLISSPRSSRSESMLPYVGLGCEDFSVDRVPS